MIQKARKGKGKYEKGTFGKKGINILSKLKREKLDDGWGMPRKKTFPN